MNARELFGSNCTDRHRRLAGFAGARAGSSACPHGQAGHFAHATLARRRPLCRMPAKSLTGRLSLRKPPPRRGRCQHCAVRPERLDAELVSVNLARRRRRAVKPDEKAPHGTAVCPWSTRPDVATRIPRWAPRAIGPGPIVAGPQTTNLGVGSSKSLRARQKSKQFERRKRWQCAELDIKVR